MERKINSIVPISFYLTSVANPSDGFTGATCTVNIKKSDSASFVLATGSVVEAAYGWYVYTPSATDYSALGDLLFHITATGANPADFKLDIVDNIESDTFAVVSNINTTSDAIYTAVQGITTEGILGDIMRMNFYQYRGSANNIFSRIDGNFVGSIDFYTVSMANFLIDSVHPPLTNRLCTLSSAGVMSNTTNLGVSGEVLFFTLSSNFNATSDVVLNFYNDVVKTNTQIYIPEGTQYVVANDPYYPSVNGVLYRQHVDSNRVTASMNTWSDRAVSLMTQIDWDKVVAPIIVNQPSISMSNVVKMNIIKDRTIDMSFDLRRNITGDSIYFAMKNDKTEEFYAVEPILCTIDDATKGIVLLTIPETATENLEVSKYYGELFRDTASGKKQTLLFFDIDLIYSIIATKDI